ncbi:MAG: 6-carboxytetrahydropterin synthase [Vicinamibacteria bacterium]|nr:6-carboxytetrahydropterin synthase [Vicinamibacteria bacterium]
MFEVSYETTFCAIHRLVRDRRPIEPVHGHNWKVEAVAAGETLDATGLVLDFEALRRAVEEVAATLSYKDINADPGFADQSPSTEALARHFFHAIRRRLGAQGDRMRRVRIWEAPGCSASYVED